MVANQTHYVIVGASAAGMAAREAIREQDPAGLITVLSDEPDMPYFRPLIPFIISGKKSASEISLVGQGAYHGTGINVRLNARVDRINTEDQRVVISGGEQIPYDKLLIATGSQPHVPPEIEGTDAEGVFALRTLSHARAAAKRAEETKHGHSQGGFTAS